ncbi:MAG: type IV pilus assembly protein PilM [bacterium]
MAFGLQLRKRPRAEKPVEPVEKKPKAPKRRIKRTRSFVGIDFLSNQVRLAQISKHGKETKLERVAIANIPPDLFRMGRLANPAQLGEVLTNIMFDAGITGTFAVVSLSGLNSVVRVITLPKMSKSQLRETIEVQLGQFIPFPPEDTIYEYRILGEVTEEETPMYEVLLAAARYSVVAPLVRGVIAAGLSPVAVKVGYMSALSVLRRYYEDFAQSVAIVDVRDKITDIAFVAENTFQFSRTVEFGLETIFSKIGSLIGLSGKDIRDRLREEEIDLMMELPKEGEGGEAHENARLVEAMKSAFQSFANELVRSVRYYEAKTRRKLRVGRVVMVGGVSGFVNLDNFLMESMGMDVVIGDPLENIDYSTAEWYPPEFKANISEITVALGLAVDGYNPKTRRELSMLPREFLVRKKVQNVVLAVAAVAVAGTLYLLTVNTTLDAKVASAQSELRNAQQAAQQLEHFDKEFNDVKNKMQETSLNLKSVAILFGSMMPWSVLMEEIRALAPTSIWLGQTLGGSSSGDSGIDLSALPSVQLDGQSIGLIPIFAYAKAIYNSEVFVGDVTVSFKEATQVGSEGGAGGGAAGGGGASRAGPGGGSIGRSASNEASMTAGEVTEGVGGDLGGLINYFNITLARTVLYDFTLKFQMDPKLVSPTELMDKLNQFLGGGGGTGGGR